MKAQLIFSAALLLSVTSFAQQAAVMSAQKESGALSVAKSKTSVNGNSSTSVKAESRQGTELSDKVSASKNEAKEAALLTTEKSKSEAKSMEGKAKGVENEKAGTNANLFVNAKDASTISDNKMGQGASIKVAAGANSNTINETGVKSVSLVNESSTAAKTRVHKMAVETQKAGAEIKQDIKPRPATIGLHGHVAANAGLRIK